MTERVKYSVVVPLYNEAGNVAELYRRIVAACDALGAPYEVIFVDDGSTDDTRTQCQALSPLTLVELRKNFGQTAAFDAGFKQARGDIIITLDGDLQNDPADIPLLLKTLDEGYDVVSGWRFERRDPLLKHIASRTANLMRKALFKDTIHDSGCALKVYRRECLESLDLYGEMHRFIPALLTTQGFRVGEVKVSHHPRLHGVSKYNWRRYLKSLVDMISVWFWSHYAHRPLHLFGSAGLLLFFAGAAIIVWMAVDKIVFGIDLANRIWPLMGALLVISGLQLFTVGIISDILIKTYYRGHQRMNYSVRAVTRR